MTVHWLLEVVVISKLLVVLAGFAYWRVCATTGICYSQLDYLQCFLFAFSESLLFAVLLLIAKGWNVTRWELPVSEIRTICVALILLLATLLFFSLYNDSYYFLSLMIMYFFMLPKIFTAISRNLKKLSMQRVFLERLLEEHRRNGQGFVLPPHLPDRESIDKKLKMFKYLKVC